MREAEILPSGDVRVEKRKIGRLEGFRFAAAAEDLAALQADGAESAPLPAEIYALQAERFAAAPNGDIHIAQDGSVRWVGDIIAKLKAGDSVLQPGFILLADSGADEAAREKISARLARFVQFHFETALKPLYDLANAEALFEKPRFVALRLVEHLGIVPRRDIAAPVKELDQEARTALRRLGVRFGVYHIFVPALLKPAPAAALTLLWALKHGAQDHAGYGDVVSYLMAGRTSFAVDDSFNRQFYRLAGYRILGKQAVRLDMLERCADLIRQAVTWQPQNAALPRPDGAYDGRRFTMTQAMLSILGATPEEMEGILRRLGYVAQPISEADYEAFLDRQSGAQGGQGQAADAAQPNLPQAEPVGDWLPAAVAEAESAQDSPLRQAEKEAAAKSRSGLRPVRTISAIPAAEPVGALFDGMAAEQPENAVILLWRYQKRSAKKPPLKTGGGQAAPGRGRDFAKPHTAGRDAAGQSGADRRGQDTAERRGRDGKDARAFSRSGSKVAAGSGVARGARGEGGKRAPHGNGKHAPRDHGADKARGAAGGKQSKPINIADSPFAALAALRDKLRK